MADTVLPAYAPCSDEQFAALEAAGLTADQATAICATILTAAADAASSAAADSFADLKYGLNSGWLVLCGALVFIMHGGFAMLCAGAIRQKNTMNILLQTVLDAAVSAIAFYTLGFGFAYGESQTPNKFIGDALFGMKNWKYEFSGVGTGRWTDWFYQWAFAATATTIPAGAVAERFNFNAYLGYSVFISAFVYPVVVHWVWSRQGWLSYALVSGAENGKQDDEYLFKSGMIDFAGSGVVHMVGGLAGMMGAILVGPRLGRFDADGRPIDMPGHSATLVVLGTVLLWFGWYGFNPGSTLIIDNSISGTVAGRAAVTTTLSGAAGGISCLLNAFRRHKAWDLGCLCNGALVGFVSITACAHVVEPWAAILAGGIGGLIFDGVCALFLKFKIDDPLSAAPMHGFCGAWSVFFTGLLAKQEYVAEAYGRSDFYGLFYKGGGRLLASQVVGILVIAAWVCTLMGIFFFIFKKLGMLRIPEEEEHKGLDASKHGGAAYNDGPGEGGVVRVSAKQGNKVVDDPSGMM